jgi:hypothetical protein
MVIALGVTLCGEKVVLGFVQTATENEPVCTSFLRGLVERGLKYDQGLLVVLDGAKGLRKAVDKVFGKKAAVQRCHWHKRENPPRRAGLPADRAEAGDQAEVECGVREAHVHGGEGGPAADPGGTGGSECLGGGVRRGGLLDIEPRLRKVSGYEHLPRLRAALEVHAKGTLEKVA